MSAHIPARERCLLALPFALTPYYTRHLLFPTSLRVLLQQQQNAAISRRLLPHELVAYKPHIPFFANLGRFQAGEREIYRHHRLPQAT